MFNWPDLWFPAINLWTVPKQNPHKNKPMNNCREAIDDDLDYFYDHAEKVGKRTTEKQEEQFCSRVLYLTRAEKVSDIEARRVAFTEMFG
jgi:hypothetical protein